MTRLIPVSDALDRLLSVISPTDLEGIKLQQCVGRVLGSTISAQFDLPRFTNSSMDGFAVRSADVEQASSQSPIKLKVIADIPAGDTFDQSIDSGQCARIMTGAQLPYGADAVVPVEQTSFQVREAGAPTPDKVEIYQAIKQGDFVREQGEDISKGEIVYQPGIRLRPQDLGYLAMLGIIDIDVHKKPRVAILSTGDELLPVGAPLEPGKIYNSNSYTLFSLVEKYGGYPINLGIASDIEEDVRDKLFEAEEKKVDLIVSSAGVSVGAFDYVRTVVEQFGSLRFWRVNMRPGKPLAFGDFRGIPFIGLPGNPVSAFVGFEVFVRPALQKMSGVTNHNDRERLMVILGEQVESDGRESYLRAIVTKKNNQWIAKLTGHQGSGNLRSIVQANALILIPSGVKSLPIGSEIEAWII